MSQQKERFFKKWKDKVLSDTSGRHSYLVHSGALLRDKAVPHGRANTGHSKYTQMPQYFSAVCADLRAYPGASLVFQTPSVPHSNTSGEHPSDVLKRSRVQAISTPVHQDAFRGNTVLPFKCLSVCPKPQSEPRCDSIRHSRLSKLLEQLKPDSGRGVLQLISLPFNSSNPPLLMLHFSR